MSKPKSNTPHPRYTILPGYDGKPYAIAADRIGSEYIVVEQATAREVDFATLTPDGYQRAYRSVNALNAMTAREVAA